MIDYGWTDADKARVAAIDAALAKVAAPDRAALTVLAGEGVFAAGRPRGDGSRGAVAAGLIEHIARARPELWPVVDGHAAALAALDAIGREATAATQGAEIWAWCHGERREPGFGEWTRATPDGDGWRLVGAKAALPLGSSADRLLVSAREGDSATSLLFVVAVDHAGLTWESARLAGAPDLPSARPTFDIRLDAAALVARGDEAQKAIGRAEARAALGAAAAGLGMIEGALETAMHHAMETTENGRKLVARQHVHFAIADIKVEADAIRRTLDKAADRWATGEPDADDLVAIIRVQAAKQTAPALKKAAEILGAATLPEGHPLDRWIRASAWIAGAGGSTEIWIERLAARALDALR